MRLVGIDVALPSRTVTNNDVLRMVEAQSADRLGENLSLAMKRIEFYLAVSGSNERRWLDAGEVPFDFLERAIEGACAQASLDKSQIELIIYTGVDRGFLEPAAAYLVAAGLGMPQAHCFDVVDACMSWCRAVFIVASLFATGKYRNALVVNCEFNVREGGVVNPSCFTLTSVDQVDWTFPAYTLGEAATASLFVREGANPWEFHFASAPDLSDLCTVPIDGYHHFCRPHPRLGRNGPNKFTSFGGEMFRLGKAPALEVFNRLSIPHNEIAAIFPHAASKQLWWEMGSEIGVQDKIWFVYPGYGNLVSASVPAGIAMAISEGAIKRGDNLAGWVGSAGMSFAAFAFQL